MKKGCSIVKDNACPADIALQKFTPPVSILKPLKGLDDNLFDNLESFCHLDYPEYEIIYSLQDYNDPAYKIAKKIKDKYHEKDISIIVERCNEGLNPKINNLIPAYRVSKYQYILISDSNVQVDKDYLADVASCMSDPDVGLVSNLIRGMSGRTFGSVLENLHLNSFIIGSVCFLDKFLKMPCVIGKSMLMKKSDLKALGGLTAVKDVLAEDYIIGRGMHEMGKKVVLSNHVIDNVNEYWGFGRFINRHTRWAKMRLKIGGIKYFSELVGNPVFISAVPFVYEQTQINLIFAMLVSVFKVLGDILLGKKLHTKMNSFCYLFSPLRDMLIGIIWFVPLISQTVIWRGNKYVIRKDSRLSPCPENGIWSIKYRFTDSIRALLAW
jgi:ceramide glucosyltransferase